MKMKTKFLFSAAILSSMFAACTNDDLVQAPKADLDNSGRIMVGKVTLDFGSNPSTRMDYDSETDKFAWDGTETIGALLMDEVYGTGNSYRPYKNPTEWANLTWVEKYQLTDYINTDYPFSWDATAKAWVSNAKMLEGNYFFAYPYEGYNGERQLVHSLANQVQEGSTKEAMEEGAAKNQYWIGYSQINAGIENKDVLATVKMARVLAPISFAIKVTGTQKYTIKKITIQGDDLKTMITIDPTDAAYSGSKKYNLEDGVGSTAGNVFNYANFTGNETDLYTNGTPVGTETQNIVYNIDEAANYAWGDAIRAAVHAGSNAAADKEYAELYINNAPAIGTGDASVYGMIFVNTDNAVASGKLKMSIYTDKGIVKDIDLTTVNTEIKAGVSTAITDKAISVLAPTTRNFINIQIDDNSFDATDNLTVNNVDDLGRFIDWNLSKNRTFTATLANNNTLTKEMATKLKAAKAVLATPDNLLKVKAAVGGDQKLTIAADVDADILNYIDVEEVNVEILGKVTVDDTKAVKLPVTTKKIIVAEGAELTLSAVTKAQLDVENNGNIKVDGTAKNILLTNNKKAAVTVNGSLAFQTGSANNGKITVEATGELMGKDMTNSAEIDNYGKIWNVTNAAKAVVTTASDGTNNFDANPTNATILLRAITDKITFTTGSNTGTIKYVGGDVDMSAVNKADVTDLVITSGYFRIDDNTTSELVNLTIDGGTLIEGGGYTGANSSWVTAETKLDFATSGVVTLTGAANLTINNADLDDATVAILKGKVTLTNKVTFGETITLGSVTGYTKNGVSMDIKNGATVAFTSIAVNSVATGAAFSISNDGTATYASGGTVAADIVVNGNAITQKI